MKKLIYSTLSLLLVASTLFVGCGKDDGTGTGTTVEKGPNITFQTNSGGSQTGFTFADGSALVGDKIKIGIRISSDVNLKSSKLTVKYNAQAESNVHDSTYTSNTKLSNKDVEYTIPADKGIYVFTIYATDKDNNTKTAKITIKANGPLLDREDGVVYSLKATGADKFSAFDLLLGEAITASSSVQNTAFRDIVDASTSATLSKTWKSQNGTEFIISGDNGTLNGKTISQFKNDQEIIDAWNALSSTKSTQINNVDIGKLIIAKSTRDGNTYYYLIGINDVSDEPGSEDDFYDFSYKQ